MDLQPVKYPPDVQNCIDTFRRWYVGQYSGRQIRTESHKGTANVLVQFNAKCRKTLVVSTYQMILLLLFNEKNTWTFKEMLEATGTKYSVYNFPSSIIHTSQTRNTKRRFTNCCIIHGMYCVFLVLAKRKYLIP